MRQVETIRDQIYYRYSKASGRIAFGIQAGGRAFGFVWNAFLDLKNGKREWTQIEDEPHRLQGCAYCGSTASLEMDYLIPRSNEVCSSCEGQERVRGTVLVCPKCREAKGEQGLYSFFKIKFPESEDFADRIPPLIEQTYLIQMYRCHECAGTLDVKDFPEGRAVTALDVDSVLVYRG